MEHTSVGRDRGNVRLSLLDDSIEAGMFCVDIVADELALMEDTVWITAAADVADVNLMEVKLDLDLVLPEDEDVSETACRGAIKTTSYYPEKTEITLVEWQKVVMIL